LNILWDLDGTIVDTIPSLVQTFCTFAKKYHDIEVDEKIVDELTRLDSMELFAYYGIEYSDENVNNFRKVNRNIPIDKLPLFDDVKKVFEIANLNVLVTNRNRRSTEEILKFWDIEKYFKEIICVDDKYPKKPDPTSYRYINHKYKIDLVIGDRDLDLIPARELGIKTCSYRNENCESDYKISNYSELQLQLHKFK
jgi:phosphoglycolate phosphatase-like HAD superfamily hydrolase